MKNIQLLQTDKGWFLAINEVVMHDGGLTDEQLLNIYEVIGEEITRNSREGNSRT